jgi:hypothetical protein
VGHFPAGGSGGIEEITSSTLTVTDPTGPTTDIETSGSAGVSSFNTRTGAVVPASGDYTAAEVTGAAPLASPTFTGTPAAPTQTTGDNTTALATDQFVQTASGLLLAKANNLSDVADAGSSRFNLSSPALSAPAAVAVANVNIASPGGTLDGYTLLTNDEILLTAQATSSQNGIWIWNGATSALSRPNEFPHLGVVKRGRTCMVGNGTVFAGTVWQLTAPAAGLTIDSTAEVWTLSTKTLSGILTSIPPSTGGGLQYFATDDNGGRLWIDTGLGTLTGSLAGWQASAKAGELYGAQMTSQFAVPSTTFGASSIFMTSPTVQVYNRPIRLTLTFAMLAALSTTRFQVGFAIDGSNAGSGAWFFWNLNLTPASQQDTRTVSLILGGAQAVGQGGHTFGAYALAQVITTSIIDATAGRPVSFTVEEL